MTDNITKADVRDGREALAKVLEAEQQIAIAKACNLDCDEDDARCKQLKGFLTQFLELYGPKFPTR